MKWTNVYFYLSIYLLQNNNVLRQKKIKYQGSSALMIAPTRLFCIYENCLICLFLFTPIKDIELAAGRWLTPRCCRSIQTKLLATNCGPVVCPIWEFLTVASAFRADGDRCHSCLPFFLQVKKKKRIRVRPWRSYAN